MEPRKSSKIYFNNNGSTTGAWISVSTGKCLTALIMFVTVLIVILFPIFLVRRLHIDRQQTSFKDRFKLWVGRLSCFAAGVFLSTGFLDIFPDVIEAFKVAGIKLQMKITFPLASFFTLLGFFLILSIEQLILIYNETVKTKRDSVNYDTNSNHVAPIGSSQVSILNDPDRINESTYRGGSDRVSDDDHDHFSHADNGNHGDDHHNLLHHSRSRIIALMSAISVHAVFEGFAIGLGTTIAGVTQLFLALSLHKLIIAGSLGLNLATAELGLCFKIVVGLIFALGSPIGIVAGMGVMELQSKGNKPFFMIAGALEGIACGTFMYVVFFEILPHEMGHQSREDRGGKLTGVILGFILVCLYLLFI